jgi:uncharacterized protein (TIGR00269 family)
MEAFEDEVRETLKAGRMIEDGDRIAVALSGGKDSAVLLYVLKKILAGEAVELFAITIDEGIKGYREDTIGYARRISDELEVELEMLSFRDEFGSDLDRIVKGRDQAPCTFCGVLRKSALNRAARDLRATKLATGHNLDDEAQSVMMNYLKGDIERLFRLSPRRPLPGLVPRIKPLRHIPEKEVALYGILVGVYPEAPECPYAHSSLRFEIRRMMNGLERDHPGTKSSVLRGFEKILRSAEDRPAATPLSCCRICGEPTFGDLCKACHLLGRVD